VTVLRQLTTTPNDTMTDAFGRGRMGLATLQLSSVFDLARGAGARTFAHRWDSRITGTGTITNADSGNGSAKLLTLPSGSVGTDAVTTQTKQYFQYRAGQSVLVALTFCLDTPDANAEQRVGLFDDADGLFFQVDGDGTARFRVRSSVAGFVVNTDDVAQASWSDDPMDGTGPSGVTLDFTKAQILVIDYQYLGVGTCRFGWSVDGVLIWAHRAHHSNVLTGVYMRSGSLPVRYEVEATGITGANVVVKQICSEVAREGSTVDTGVDGHVYNNTSVSLATGTTWTALLGVRLKAGNIRALLRDFLVSVQNFSGTSYAEWQLVLNPTLTAGTPWAAPLEAQVNADYSVAEWFDGGGTAASATITTPQAATGVRLAHGYSAGGQRGGGAVLRPTGLTLPAVASIAGVPDEVILLARSISGGATVRAGLGWVE